MNKNLSFLPINNHYSPIDLPTLKSNNFKTGTMKRKGVEMPLIIEISKYSNELLNKSQSKESIIINSKEIVKNSVNENKTSYYNLVDMLNIKPKKINLANILNQRYLKTFSTLDIELAQNQNTMFEFTPKTLNFKILSKMIYITYLFNIIYFILLLIIIKDIKSFINLKSFTGSFFKLLINL